MKSIARALAAAALLVTLGAFASDQAPTVDWDMAARIREEGLQRSQVMDIVGYMTDVLGGRLTLSQDMKRAQLWAKDKMEKLGLENVVIEPFMDYGAAWDNEYFSLQMLEPDYQPMVGFPVAYTSGTKGRVAAPAVLAVDILTKKDLERYRGKLKGAIVLSTPPYTLDMAALTQGVARLTADDLAKLEEAVVPRPQRAPVTPPPPNPDLIKPEERLDFFKAEGVIAVLQCTGGQMGAAVGFSRPGANEDHWSREKTLGTLPIIAVTPEHYNRMFRILKRGLPVKVELDVRNRVGEKTEKAANVLGEIPGTDLADEVVMLGAHFDSWHEAAGASDTAAGCAVALEAARILKTIGVKPRRTIRVAFWAGEEQGLHGSREYVNAHFGNPRDPKVGAKPGYDKFCAYFNQDYGAGQFRGIYLQGNERVRRTFAAWMEPFKDFGLTALSIQSVGSTDHVSFDAAGLPGFQFIQDRLGGTYGHTNLDFYDTLRAEDLMKNAVVEAFFAWQAAMADERIPRKPLK
jgi:hypothetical protein